MECNYITIEREYGSGGTEIARLLAKEANISCYGQEILEELSREKEVSIERIERYEENVTNSILYSVYALTQAVTGKTDMLTKEAHLYLAEQTVIKRLAANGPAVFLGHCASESLKGQSGVIHVFIRCTDEAAKRRRIVEDYGIEASQADSVRRKFDKKRANYYYANTLKKWDDFKNYDLVLDSGKLGIACCANLLKTLFLS